VSDFSPESSKTPEKKKSRRGLYVAIGSVAGLAIAGGAIFAGIAANQAPQSQPTAEASADPSQEAIDKNEPLPSEAALEIPAGLSAQEVGTTLIERYDTWNNAGSNNQTIIDDWLNSPDDVSTGDYVTARAQEYAKTFAAALYIPDWDAPGLHPDLVKDDNAQVAINANTLEDNLKTSDPSNGDIEPYRNILTVDAVRQTSSGDGTRVIEVDYTQSSNADQNRVGEEFGAGAASSGTYVFTLVTVDGTERIAAVTIR
jgi:hypothetical protein